MSLSPLRRTPVPTPQQLQQAHYAACAAKEAAKIAAFVALPAQERQSRRDSSCLIFLPLLGLVLFFFHPIVALLCMPITIGLAVAACNTKHAPSGAPSEEEIFRAEVLKRLK